MNQSQSNPLNKKQKRFLNSVFLTIFIAFAALLILL